MEEQQILDILLSEDYVSEEDIATATARAKEQQISVTQVLVATGIITKDLIGQAVAEYYEVPFVDVKRQKIDTEIFFSVPEVFATTHQVVALAQLKAGVKVGMLNPKDVDVLALLEKRLGQPVIPYFALREDIESAFSRYEVSIQEKFDAIVHELAEDGIDKEEKDEITTKVVDVVLQYGHKNHASDVHVEPLEQTVLVRFRIDGVLHDVLTLQKELYEQVLSRIKILSKMRIDQHRSAQDGKLRFDGGNGETVDVRVSVVPTKHGENIVMRLLSSKNRQFALASLGMLGEDLKKVQRIITHPHGMILVTGPTGSGKSTSLYAVLKILNRREVNIATIEDPVEYDIEGVTQIQVDTNVGLTFAKGLRALVRQDPDIIMVGEIRDEETAGIAVNSALTGHLVLSTLHTNDAATALPRLLDMKVEPFLVASTVNVIIAQRLVRKICRACIVSYAPTKKEKDLVTKDASLTRLLKSLGKTNLKNVSFYKGAGCKVCNNTGYEGRMGVFEILEMTDTIRDMVMKNNNADEIKAQAAQDGMTTMMQDGIRKVLSGDTTIDEVLRVARD